MKIKVLTVAIASSFLLMACGADGTTQGSAVEATQSTTPELNTMESKISYLIAYNNIKQMKHQEVEFDIEAFITGATHANDGVDSKFSEEEAQKLFSEFQAQLQEKAKLKAEVAGAANQAASEAFLKANADKEGVMTTESGLQYKVLSEGTGTKPTAESTVQVNYEGTLIDGTVFDSSFERGTPIEFPLSGVIKGWTEGLQLMPEGSSFEFYIPSELAYGARGPASIGPNQALIFKVDLIQANFKAPE